MRNLATVLTVTLSLTLITPATADWFYDFHCGVIPDTFETRGILQGGPPFFPSPTFEASADGGFLRMFDIESLTPIQGGTYFARGFDPEVFLGDVRVTAEVNSTGHSNDLFGVGARRTTLDTGYFAGLSFMPRDFRGQFFLSKEVAPPNETPPSFRAGVSDGVRAKLLHRTGSCRRPG